MIGESARQSLVWPGSSPPAAQAGTASIPHRLRRLLRAAVAIAPSHHLLPSAPGSCAAGRAWQVSAAVRTAELNSHLVCVI